MQRHSRLNVLGGAPYPVFLALGGALPAFVPGAPSITLPPELALAIFVAPILLDAAYDASLRDLKDNWAPVTSLVVFAVVFTTLAVAIVVRALLPAFPGRLPALGAVVAPPDAVAATAVLRQLRPPHRILTRQKPAQRRRGPVDLPSRRGVVGPSLGWRTLRLSNASSTCRPRSTCNSSARSASGFSPSRSGSQAS